MWPTCSFEIAGLRDYCSVSANWMRQKEHVFVACQAVPHSGSQTHPQKPSIEGLPLLLPLGGLLDQQFLICGRGCDCKLTITAKWSNCICGSDSSFCWESIHCRLLSTISGYPCNEDHNGGILDKRHLTGEVLQKHAKAGKPQFHDAALVRPPWRVASRCNK